MSRSTLVFHRENGAWRVLHAHFSEGDKGRAARRRLTRPGGRRDAKKAVREDRLFRSMFSR